MYLQNKDTEIANIINSDFFSYFTSKKTFETQS